MTKQNKVTKQDKKPLENGFTPSKVLGVCVGTFVANKDIASMSVQTDDCAISFGRNVPQKRDIQAIGFCADVDDVDDCDDIDEDDHSTFVERYITWFD